MVVLTVTSILAKDSVIVIPQIKVMDRRRLLEKITKIDRAIIEKVENSVLLILGLKN